MRSEGVVGDDFVPGERLALSRISTLGENLLFVSIFGTDNKPGWI
jgi:hypothetical protein